MSMKIDAQVKAMVTYVHITIILCLVVTGMCEVLVTNQGVGETVTPCTERHFSE